MSIVEGNFFLQFFRKKFWWWYFGIVIYFVQKDNHLVIWYRLQKNYLEYWIA